MKIKDLIAMCLRNLTRRKVRTALTVTGVVVGTCSIIIMISLGLAQAKNMEDMLAQMGDLSVIEVYNYSGNPKGVKLDDPTLAQIKNIPGVDVVTPFYQPYDMSMKLLAGRNDRYEMQLYNMVGVYPEALEKLGYELLDGNFLTGGLNDGKKITVLVGQNASFAFRDTRKRGGYNDMVWPEMDENGKVTNKPFLDITKEKLILRTQMQKEETKPIELEVRVVGTIKEDWSKGYETSQGMFVDINELKALLARYNKANGIKATANKGYENIKVKAVDIDSVAAVEQAIKDMGFEQTYSMESIRKPMQEQARQQQLFLGGLGAISLFVAAIGITNTMVMSIYERTREIGVMKVLGCELRDLRAMFLMEAGSIGFLGGVAGILLSFGLSFLMNYAATMGGGGDGGMGMGIGMGSFLGGGMPGRPISIIPTWLVVASLVFSTLVGLVSGYSPANRAVKISSLEAIKHD